MSDLHSQIMNIPAVCIAWDSSDAARGEVRAYKEGHRDARHAAAELAAPHAASLADAQAEIARLQGALEKILDSYSLGEAHYAASVALKK